jgi:hypothetical protein
MNIYVVENFYEGVVTVFSSFEKADKYLQKFNKQINIYNYLINKNNNEDYK